MSYYVVAGPGRRRRSASPRGGDPPPSPPLSSGPGHPNLIPVGKSYARRARREHQRTRWCRTTARRSRGARLSHGARPRLRGRRESRRRPDRRPLRRRSRKPRRDDVRARPRGWDTASPRPRRGDRGSLAIPTRGAVVDGDHQARAPVRETDAGSKRCGAGEGAGAPARIGTSRTTGSVYA